MSQRLYLPFEQVFSNLGAIGAGYKLYTYLTQTDTPKATYSNTELTIANTNPIIADSAGRFANIYGSSATLYKFILKTSADVTIDIADPVDPQTFTLTSFNPMPAAYWGVTAGTSSAYTLDSDVDISLIGYQNNQIFALSFHTACVANPTINIDGLGALNLKKYTGQGTKIGLQAGDVTTQRYWATNDGTDIIILNPVSSPIYTGVAPTLTIASGVVAVTNTGSNYLLATEGGAATDDLETINGLSDGEIVYLQIADAAKNVVIKQTGNIFIQTGVDITLDLTTDIVGFKYNAALAKAVLITATTSASGMVLLDTKTAANSTTLEFTAGINSIYSKYVFDLHGIYPATNQAKLGMQVSEDSGATWKSGATDYSSTTNMASQSGMGYSGGNAAAIAVSDFNVPTYGIVNNANGALCGTLSLYDPSGNGNVKRIIGINSYTIGGVSYINNYSAIYKATTNSINAVRFLMDSGNITAGKIKMFGVL